MSGAVSRETCGYEAGAADRVPVASDASPPTALPAATSPRRFAKLPVLRPPAIVGSTVAVPTYVRASAVDSPADDRLAPEESVPESSAPEKPTLEEPAPEESEAVA
jgi:hypothetical protein